tara:strand:+ start:1036 stop:1662 length:627 start_codon:yes stop_codon:yes gene_type:complete
MIHCFSVELAVKYGMEEAVFIENVRLWLNSNKAANRNFHKNKYWTYNTAKAYAILFPYWNAMKVHRITKSLEIQGVLQVDSFSSNGYDRTKWYTFTDSFDLSNLQNGDRKIAKSSINTYINTDTCAISNFEEFWTAYPRKTNKGFTRKVFAKLNPSEELLKKMIYSIAQHKKQWTDPKYIPHPSTWLNGERWEDELEAKKPNRLAGAI